MNQIEPLDQTTKPLTQKALSIALLTYATKPRGSVIHTLELAAALQKLGHRVCIYALDKDGQGFDRDLNVEVKLVSTQSAPTDIDRLIRQRIQEFVDYFQTMNSQPGNLGHDYYHAQDCLSANALAILRQAGCISHFIRTIHHIEDYQSSYLQQCQDRSIRAADLCLSVSQVWQTAIREQYGIDAPRVLNGVNRQRFSAEPTDADAVVKQQLGLHGYPLYLTVGGIEPRKNSINLLRAFAAVLPTYPNAQLIIAGGATLFDYQAYREAFFAEVERLGIGRSLILPGVLSDADLPALYRCADAFVFPSIQEGWGLVLLEAIASGLPVITSNQAPFTEFLTPAQAYLVDPASPSAIAAAMQSVADPAIAAELIQHSQSVLTDYTWEQSARLHIQFYQTTFIRP
jgi:glycosyltransferase-like protein